MDDSLVLVISKLKKYVKTTTGCSLSMEAIGVINNKVLEICQEASRRAQFDRRKIIKHTDV
ncbi:MAG TPA: hypothetical protein PKY81_05705 [bacterium]|nr:hypothetical protein [bacterium]HPN30433.1 hypothetical protein [bacterium]